MEITFKLNGKQVSVETVPTMRLLDVLREEFGLIGVKEACGEGECGACAVIMDGRLVHSCLVPVAAANGSEILTIEGYRETERHKVLMEAFAEAGAVQCGFCTPGFVMAIEALLRRNPHPDEDEIKEAISGNICRCTGYDMIIDAVKIAAKKGEGLW